MKNVLLIGACGGMGKSIANKLISNGYNVFGLDIKDNPNIKNLNYYKCDITNKEQLHNVYNDIFNKVDNLYSIVFASGIYKMGSLLEISDEEMKKIVDINVLSVQRINKIFFPLLKRGSKIVIITSELATLDPLPFNGIYTITKSFLDKYAFSLRMEVNNFGIKVVVIRPGAVDTNMIGDSTNSLSTFVNNTEIHKDASYKFKKIIDSVEAKKISPDKIGLLVNKIMLKKNPHYVYSVNRNFFLKLLNFLPDKMQVKIISKLLRK